MTDHRGPESLAAVITGATGFIGRQLAARLRRPVVLSRNAQRAQTELGDVRAVAWDTRVEVPLEALDGAQVVFNLAGEPIAEGRWTAEKKARIRESRVEGTQRLVAGLARLESRPLVLVSASAVGWYPDGGDRILAEDEPAADNFLGQICAEWEQAALAAEALGIRVVLIRTGLVLGPGGGALGKMLPLFRAGLGGRLGDGRQWMPWIHLDDLVEMMLFAATHASLRGPINGVAPNPVTNAEFTRTLGRVLHRPALFPAPRFALRLALGEMADALLASQRVVPRAALAAGYAFRYAQLEPALRSILAAAG
ncbi:MAG: TIGR01777 family oxidoreductase [Pirellulales bacterium]|nr:TIGR01777 family oxidoreductase [Pirellulales bacterium]